MRKLGRNHGDAESPWRTEIASDQVLSEICICNPTVLPVSTAAT